jgi:hypothetical protein
MTTAVYRGLPVGNGRHHLGLTLMASAPPTAIVEGAISPRGEIQIRGRSVSSAPASLRSPTVRPPEQAGRTR